MSRQAWPEKNAMADCQPRVATLIAFFANRFAWCQEMLFEQCSGRVLLAAFEHGMEMPSVRLGRGHLRGANLKERTLRVRIMSCTRRRPPNICLTALFPMHLQV